MKKAIDSKKSLIAEDAAAIRALCFEAHSLLQSVRREAYELAAPESLHPAEIVLHHRLRDLAFEIGVLLPVDPSTLPADFEFPVPTKGECRQCNKLRRCAANSRCGSYSRCLCVGVPVAGLAVVSTVRTSCVEAAVIVYLTVVSSLPHTRSSTAHHPFPRSSRRCGPAASVAPGAGARCRRGRAAA